MIVRQFLPNGIEAFRAFLAACREKPGIPVPKLLLEDEALTEVVKPPIDVEPRHFEMRRDAAEYLLSLLAPISSQDVAANSGLWTWLTLFFFDEVCPARTGRRKVKHDYYYVFEPKESRQFCRHLLFIGWYTIRVAPVHNRLFLDNPVSTLDSVTWEVMARLYVTRIPCIFEVLDRLYWDAERGRPRQGMTDYAVVTPGNFVKRFSVRMLQLEKTYDLASLSADKLIDLLGPEFQFESVKR